MSEEPDHRIDELEGQMEAAGSLIKSLEEEVESLRRDLVEASGALRTAQQEVSARERALEEHDQARTHAEQQAQSLRSAMTALRIQNSDDQLQLRNQHIAELSRMQDRFGAQRMSDMGKTFSGDDAEAIKEEYRKDLQELEQRRWQEIETLETSYEEWKDGLLEAENELKTQHEEELRNLRRESEARAKDLQRELRQDYDQRLEEMRQALETRYNEEVRTLRDSLEDREKELQREYQAELGEIREQSEHDLRESEEKRKRDIREIKTLAENRERELRRGQSTRTKEAEEESERRRASLQAQRKADNEALKSRYENELARLRQEHEELLAAEVERRQIEVLSLEEKFESVKLVRASEARAYIDRLKELETSPSGPQNGQVEIEPVSEDIPEEPPAHTTEETLQLRERVVELEEALASSRTATEQLALELEELRSQPSEEETRELESPETDVEEEYLTVEDSTENPELPVVDAAGDDERVRDLEIRLREAQDERRHYADELGKALDKLRRLSDPEHRLRAGIAAFNESHHSRNVASISKALGLPRVHAGIEGDAPGKPNFTFVWEDISWRCYVADPIEGLEEPRVYLVAAGDYPEAPPPEQEPNARIDARGRLILGVQAR